MQAARPFPVPHEILRASFASALDDRRYALPVQCLLHPQPLLSLSFRAAGEESLDNRLALPMPRRTGKAPWRPLIYARTATAPANALAALLGGRWQAPPAGGSRVLSPRCITPPLPIPLNRAIHTPLFCPRMRFFARPFGLPLNDRTLVLFTAPAFWRYPYFSCPPAAFLLCHSQLGLCPFYRSCLLTLAPLLLPASCFFLCHSQQGFRPLNRSHHFALPPVRLFPVIPSRRRGIS